MTLSVTTNNQQLSTMKHLTGIDYIAVIVYFAVIGSIGLYMARRQKTTSEYFIADRKIAGHFRLLRFSSPLE
ncbi:MAG: hypothetical protein Q7T82_04865 [Armatimonadota bacterium]|nr:hypothetical protein [Armatimonadota bacterium]